jgi:hypothetical protein
MLWCMVVPGTCLPGGCVTPRRHLTTSVLGEEAP